MMEYTLKRVIARGLFTLTQITRCRSEDKHDYCIYQVHEDNAYSGKTIQHGYEVIRVLVRPEATLKDRKGNATLVPEHEGYPGDEQWGRYGFSYKTLAEAETKLASLLASGSRDIQHQKTVRASEPKSTGKDKRTDKTRVYGGKKA